MHTLGPFHTDAKQFDGTTNFENTYCIVVAVPYFAVSKFLHCLRKQHDRLFSNNRPLGSPPVAHRALPHTPIIFLDDEKL